MDLSYLESEMKASRAYPAFRLLLLALTSLSSVALFALGEPHRVTTTPEIGSFALAQRQSLARIYVDSADWAGVLRAASSFSSDVAQVTGRTPEIIHNAGREDRDIVLIGTIGSSSIIDRLIRNRKLTSTPFAANGNAIQVVSNPLPGIASALVIAGSDKRGTIFGIYDLSEQIGVSPWYWWADVPVAHRDALYVDAGRYSG